MILLEKILDYNYLHKNVQIFAHLLDRNINCQLTTYNINNANNRMKLHAIKVKKALELEITHFHIIYK